ncbi:MAG: hypothetical protein RLZZ568_1617 [Cyanobacteriota bacterium]
MFVVVQISRSVEGMNKYDQSSRPWWIQHLDKGVFAGGIFYVILVTTGILWQARQPAEEAIAEGKPAEIVTPADQEFIAYLQQSLTTLKQASLAAPNVAETTVAITNESPTVSPQTPSPPPPTTTVVERYYYPVYPHNAAAPTLSQPVVPPPPQAPPAAPMVASVTKHHLVGILESGDRSTALFRWNDITQRIQLGEAIGSSGWQLTAVVGQRAILSHQGKTRYLEVGQSF